MFFRWNGDPSIRRVLLTLATLLSCWALQAASTAVGEQSIIAEYEATVATAWFELQLTLVQETPGFSPPVAARSFAYTGLTLYEAVVPVMPAYQTLVGQLNGLSALPQPNANQAYYWPAVANTALAGITEKLFSSASRKNVAAITRLEQTRALSFGLSTADFTGFGSGKPRLYRLEGYASFVVYTSCPEARYFKCGHTCIGLGSRLAQA